MDSLVPARRARTRRSLFSLLIALTMLLAGCAVQPATAPETEGTAPAATVAGPADSQGFPRTITDGLGNEVTIPQKPQRIISLTLATDEILLSLVDTARARGVTYLAGDSMWTNVSEIARPGRTHRAVRSGADHCLGNRTSSWPLPITIPTT